MSYPIGIDLGTTYSAVSYVDEHGTPRVIPDAGGRYLVPSVVFFQEDGEVIVGQLAKDCIIAYPERIVAGVKRQIGEDNWTFRANGTDYGPEHISSFILLHLKEIAEARLGPVKDAVVTVPAYFLDKERNRTIKAAEMAGFNVLGIVNEPTAAALSYGVMERPEARTLLVYDLGGGTFDVTIMRYEPGQKDRYDVITTRGNHRLGGIDWDKEIAKALDQRFRACEIGCSPLEDRTCENDLLAQCEHAKMALSTLHQTTVVFHYAGQSVRLPLTRTEFEEMTEPLLLTTQCDVDLALAEAKLGKEDLDLILLVGGSCKMPMVHRMLTGRAREVKMSRDPDHCVALGAGIHAARLNLRRQRSNSLIRSGLSKKAEEQLAKLEVSDVVPHSLGVLAVENGVLRNKIILARGNKVPCRAERSDLQSTRDGQTAIDVHVLQGESESPHACVPLESYAFEGIPPRKARETRIRVSYCYNENTIVEVHAFDVLTGVELRVGRRSIDPIQRLLSGEPTTSCKLIGGGSVVLLIDASWSMEGPRLLDAQRAAKEFLDRTDFSRIAVGLVQFGMSSKASVLAQLSQNKQQIIEGLARVVPSGSTPMDEGIACACGMLGADIAQRRYMVLLTDGSPNSEEATLTAAIRARQIGINIICIGTPGANQAFLGRISTQTSDSYFAGDGDSLAKTFGDIAEVISARYLDSSTPL